MILKTTDNRVEFPWNCLERYWTFSKEIVTASIAAGSMSEGFNQLGLFPEITAVEYRPARLRQMLRPKHPLVPFDPVGRRYAKLVLASGSPSKCAILNRLGLKFEIDPANIDEKSFSDLSPERLVEALARAKGTAVSKRHIDALVVSADTIIVNHGGIIGKPLDREDALRILTELNGNSHRVITGIAVTDMSNDRSTLKVVTTEVRFRQQSPEALARYVSTGEPMGKAGAYALQGMGALLIEQVSGEYTNVLGLPVCAFVDALNELGYELI
jgi:septum formation protein